MKNKIIIISAILLYISCNNPTRHKNDDMTSNLNNVNEKNIKTCRDFVKKFPSTFIEFNSLYGYDEHDNEGILYDKHYEHISYFFSCKEVSPSTKVRKALSICIGGKWAADAVGIFQDNTLILLREHPQVTLSFLDNLSETESTSVWYFLLDGPHPDNKNNIEAMKDFSKAFGETHKQTTTLQRVFDKLKSKKYH